MGINWLPLQSLEDIEIVKNRSKEVPCLIFKHSDRCHVCGIAKYRLEDDWDFGSGEIEAYFLDVLAFRPVSLQLAEIFKVHHESPQVLLIVGEECIYDASHMDITLKELREAVSTQ
ncbi:MAG: bacillithiol system redox-active protein YtxJ [Saprospiraceae bacterium]